MSDVSINLATTYGSILCGSMFAFALSGVLATQVTVYWHMYGSSTEPAFKRCLVIFVWLLDIVHSGLILSACWFYFISHFLDVGEADHLPHTVAFTVVSTALQTMIYHFHFAYKIHIASRRNCYITGSILALAFARLVAACVSTSEMVILQRYSAFTKTYPGWVFTLGLSLSAGVDILVSGFMCYFLWKIRSSSSITRTSKLVDNMILYTLENGVLTCLFTTSSLLCWLIMPYNLVFLGLHFVIGKLYANSLVASLNTRKVFTLHSGGAITFGDPSAYERSADVSTISRGPLSPPNRRQKSTDLVLKTTDTIGLGVRKVGVNVERTIERTSDDLDIKRITLKH